MQGAVLGTEDKAGNKMGSSSVLVDFTFKQLITQNIIIILTTYSYGTACCVSIWWGNYLYFDVREGFVEEVMFMPGAEGGIVMEVYLM